MKKKIRTGIAVILLGLLINNLCIFDTELLDVQAKGEADEIQNVEDIAEDETAEIKDENTEEQDNFAEEEKTDVSLEEQSIAANEQEQKPIHRPLRLLIYGW